MRIVDVQTGILVRLDDVVVRVEAAAGALDHAIGGLQEWVEQSGAGRTDFGRFVLVVVLQEEWIERPEGAEIGWVEKTFIRDRVIVVAVIVAIVVETTNVKIRHHTSPIILELAFQSEVAVRPLTPKFHFGGATLVCSQRVRNSGETPRLSYF